MTTLQEGHFWSEYIRTDDPFWNGIRSSLVGFYAIGRKFTPQFLGTGFVIGTSAEGFFLVLTAKHVVVEGCYPNSNASYKTGGLGPERSF
jgi:hypothetical protein